MTNPRVLIVDDVPINIQLVASILSTEPYDLSFANSGKDALGQISETDFDLILLDIMMPELDGLAVARKLKSNPLTARIPIIFLTAKSDSESVTQGFEVGASDYLTKPFSPSELLSRVKTHVALKVYENDLKQSNIELAEAVQVKNRILSVASHDLRNPLSSILGFTQLLAEYPAVKNDPELLNMMGYISRSATRMETLITELLDTAALEMGRIDLKMKRCSPDQTLRKSVQEQQLPAENKQQQLQLKSSTKAFCNADPNRLKQVFENILSNAIKYSPAGARIEIESYVQKGHWYVDIKDQGPGFSEEDLKNLYGFFQQLSARPTAGESSTGVGLAIVKQIVELHGGEVHLKANTTNGSTFCVCLPLAS